MERLTRIATAGSVDDGKSTLIGRLLLETDSLYEDQLAEIEAASQRRGRAERDLAYATDGLREERERNVTIDVAYRPLQTPRRRFLLADAPGHAEYTRNMVTAASTADLLIVLADASRGIAPQTRRHLAIAAFLRIPVLLVVNKMDLVGYEESVFESLTTELFALAHRFGCEEIRAIPVSAYRGDNVVHPSPAMPWYAGASLLETLESFPLPTVLGGPPCLEVQNAFLVEDRPLVTGTLSGGCLRVGDRLGNGTVERLWIAGDEATTAGPGAPVAVRFHERFGVRRGDRLRSPHDLTPRSDRFQANLFWMHPETLRIGMTYRLRQGPRVLDAKVRRVVRRVELEARYDELRAPSFALGSDSAVAMNDLVEVEIELREEASLDLYSDSRDRGSFVLVDFSGQTVAAGTVERLLPRRVGPPVAAPVLWLTGLSGAGKSTIAEATAARLRRMGIQTIHLDGDSLRAGLCSDLGFSAEERRENIRRAAEVAKLMVAQGWPTICSLISPLRSHREEARRILGDGFVEVFVRCDLDECVRRDPKGLYARALEGSIPGFTGIGSPYEPPENPDLILDTQTLDVDSCVDRLVSRVCLGVAP